MTDRRREELDTPSEEELDKLAEITPADVDRAMARWRKNAPAQFKDLLDAELLEENDRGGDRDGEEE